MIYLIFIRVLILTKNTPKTEFYDIKMTILSNFIIVLTQRHIRYYIKNQSTTFFFYQVPGRFATMQYQVVPLES
jgi:hypothetical protein